MAKVWSLGEAYISLCEEKKEDIADFGSRFPIATALMAKAGSSSALARVFNALGADCTMRKLESTLKADVKETVEEEETEEKKEAPAKAEKPAKTAKPKKEKAQPMNEPEVEEEDAEDAEETEGTDYSSMNAIELFKECKKRGIKADPKRKSEVYIKLLKEDDAKNADTDAEEDDWDDEEEEVPKKPAKASKPKKTAPAEDDDDDWDI